MDNFFKYFSVQKRSFIRLFFALMSLTFLLVLLSFTSGNATILSPLSNNNKKEALAVKNDYEVFGFAPYWNLGKLENIDYTVLTTLAYFGIPVNADGSFATEDIGYIRFNSNEANALFDKAHANGTRVVVTLTQMDNPTILAFLDNHDGQKATIKNAVDMVSAKGLDGINVDFEYIGNPGPEYMQKFTHFVSELTTAMHNEVPNSHVSVSVYASAVKDPKIYDIASLSKSSDGIFMMAYDFATSGSDNVIPTAPLYGHKEGKYWYDISTAVDDFLTVMPKEKLILGLPWYGYDYPVAQPEVKAEKNSGYYTYYWYRGRRYSQFIARPAAHASTYSNALSGPAHMEGWDNYGQVGWRAYQSSDGWRMMFLDDVRSLGIKYDFAKEKGLGGVGMWALGFDHGNNDMWQLLSKKFGKKNVDARIAAKL